MCAFFLLWAVVRTGGAVPCCRRHCLQGRGAVFSVATAHFSLARLWENAYLCIVENESVQPLSCQGDCLPMPRLPPVLGKGRGGVPNGTGADAAQHPPLFRCISMLISLLCSSRAVRLRGARPTAGRLVLYGMRTDAVRHRLHLWCRAVCSGVGPTRKNCVYLHPAVVRARARVRRVLISEV